ncbi:MAG: MFS transporter [Aurantimicrobium sp.]|uniref:MFS transporter n=1 Tax=Aurantimicrobium TaxID=1705353 RepID=UPI0024051DD8|nr:MFS transporter [Aurantimicrobium minutum]MDF9809752.1 MFS family permease [Aurantimicrobium minutum]MDH6255832.1 MFS family permease [Aurantimicrobium minutum]MDH6537140.1 MFS family permease [Aurantimicrobium minutum]
MSSPRSRRIHPAWIVAAVGFLALVGAAGFRAAPSVMMVPLEQEFGWNRTTISTAIGLNILLYGLMAPFAAALMARFGMRKVSAFALIMIASGSALSTLVVSPWMLMMTWGVMIGLGTGSMAMVFAATITNTWFYARKGLVSGVLSAGSATGQLVFLSTYAGLVETNGWRFVSIVVSLSALAVVPLVLIFMKDSPAKLGILRFGETPEIAAKVASDAAQNPAPTNPAKNALVTLVDASKNKTFWALAIGFAICGATTNGLIGAHFIPSAHDHGMPETTAAGLLAVVGIFDVFGTIASGWLTDRVNPRLLLALYYFGRGIALMLLPVLLSDAIHPSLILFVVIYGLDWVATVPPTIAICNEVFGKKGPIVFGWVFASHQVGASIAVIVAGAIRDQTGEYTLAWFGAAALCAVAAWISFRIRKVPTPTV